MCHKGMTNLDLFLDLTGSYMKRLWLLSDPRMVIWSCHCRSSVALSLCRWIDIRFSLHTTKSSTA